MSVVIAGAQNVGKSTLFNMLVGSERAIVDTMAGTTRDMVSERVRIGEAWVRLVDTAGLGEAELRVDNVGMERALEVVRNAWRVIWVTSMENDSIGEQERRVVEAGAGRLVMAVVTKTDVVRRERKVRGGEQLGCEVGVGGLVKREGREAIRREVERVIGDSVKGSGWDVVRWSDRQREGLRRAAEEGRMVLESDSAGDDGMAYGVKRMLDAVGETTGEMGGAEILERVFSRFCVGK